MGHEILVGRFGCAVRMGDGGTAGCRGLGQRLSTNLVRTLAAAHKYQPVLRGAGRGRTMSAGGGRAVVAVRSVPEMHDELRTAQLLSTGDHVRNQDCHGTSYDHADELLPRTGDDLSLQLLLRSVYVQLPAGRRTNDIVSIEGPELPGAELGVALRASAGARLSEG